MVSTVAFNPFYGELDPAGLARLAMIEAVAKAVAVGADPGMSDALRQLLHAAEHARGQLGARGDGRGDRRSVRRPRHALYLRQGLQLGHLPCRDGGSHRRAAHAGRGHARAGAGREPVRGQTARDSRATRSCWSAISGRNASAARSTSTRSARGAIACTTAVRPGPPACCRLWRRLFAVYDQAENPVRAAAAIGEGGLFARLFEMAYGGGYGADWIWTLPGGALGRRALRRGRRGVRARNRGGYGSGAALARPPLPDNRAGYRNARSAPQACGRSITLPLADLMADWEKTFTEVVFVECEKPRNMFLAHARRTRQSAIKVVADETENRHHVRAGHQLPRRDGLCRRAGGRRSGPCLAGGFNGGAGKSDGLQGLIFPGGFSYGDHIAAGRVYAVHLIARLGDDLRRFRENRRPILGICNGDQILMETGLLPGGSPGERHGALTQNRSARFEGRWVTLAAAGSCFWGDGLADRLIRLPSAHGEGRLVLADGASARPAFRYVDDLGGRPNHTPGIPPAHPAASRVLPMTPGWCWV